MNMVCGIGYYPEVEYTTADAENCTERENYVGGECCATFPEHTHYKYSCHGGSNETENRLEYVEEIHAFNVVDSYGDHNRYKRWC